MQWTAKTLLEWTQEHFKSKGIEKPRLEAEILLAAAMKIKRIEIYTHFNTEPAENVRAVFRDFVKRRTAGEPAAYLVGYKEFYSLPFYVDKNVLIPRPETEDLVLKVLNVLKPLTAPLTADIGTGSGAIAVALAKNTENGHIIAGDISAEALAAAKQNADKNNVAGKIDFRQSDLLDKIPEKLDMIVSNLPYVSQTEYDALPKDIKDYEPKTALLAGEKGTEVIERLIGQAKEHLKPGGQLFLEISPMIADAVLELLKNWDRPAILNDTFGRKRIATAQR